MKNKIFTCFLVCKGRSNDYVERARGTVFQEIRPGAGFQTGDFVQRRLGGATIVERLLFFRDDNQQWNGKL